MLAAKGKKRLELMQRKLKTMKDAFDILPGTLMARDQLLHFREKTILLLCIYWWYEVNGVII